MESNKKKSYIPPTVEVIRVVLETVIAASPLPTVSLKDWEYENESIQSNNSEVILYF